MSNGQQPQQLTVKEALEQGYTHFGYDNGDFQRLSELTSIGQDDFAPNEWRGGMPVLAQKEPYYFSIDAETIQDNIADHIMAQDNYHDDDNSIIPDALKEIEGWEELVGKINEKLKEYPYWYLTSIKLIP